LKKLRDNSSSTLPSQESREEPEPALLPLREEAGRECA